MVLFTERASFREAGKNPQWRRCVVVRRCVFSADPHKLTRRMSRHFLTWPHLSFTFSFPLTTEVDIPSASEATALRRYTNQIIIIIIIKSR